jgi:hypothetical protein
MTPLLSVVPCGCLKFSGKIFCSTTFGFIENFLSKYDLNNAENFVFTGNFRFDFNNASAGFRLQTITLINNYHFILCQKLSKLAQDQQTLTEKKKG